ncbi:MAG: hypothetical protein JSU69_05490 [Candidatus Zixiibacteriota bacterium]|nr:MAG: hypothetical protein JSU69_05490 [candidate division Zixibacteria bacterium]
MKHLIRVILLIIMSAPLLSAEETLVNWNAGYYVTYPDDWYHVPYRDVNIFLTSQRVSRLEFDYDAVLARKSDKPFHEEPYIFLSSILTDELNRGQIDSVLDFVSNEYGHDYIEASVTPGDRKLELDRPIYDRSLNVLAIKDRVTSEFTDKMLLEIRKFYENGMAIFLCYSSKDDYNEVQPIFIDIIASFSTKDLDKAAPKDSFEIVDLSERESGSYEENDFPGPRQSGKGMSSTTKRIIFIFLLVVITVGVIRVFVFKKRK